MTGLELKALRSRSGLGWSRFGGAALGFGGTAHTIARKVKRLEALGDDRVPETVAIMATLFERKLERIERKWEAEEEAR